MKRQELAAAMTAQETADLIRQRTEDNAPLVLGLTDDQLALPTRPPRARVRSLADTIERVLIGHYDKHRRDIERKLRDGT